MLGGVHMEDQRIVCSYQMSPYEIRHIEELLTSIAHAMLRMKGFLSLKEEE